METRILDGKALRDLKAAAMKEELSKLGAAPRLAIVQVGSRDESNAYIRQKKAFGESLGCAVTHVELPEDATTEALLGAVERLDADRGIHGIIVQLPLPAGVDAAPALSAISPEKDVDGLGAESAKRLLSGAGRGHMPATARGIVSLLDHYGIPIEGGRAVVVGRSDLVGKPTALALIARNATVTVAHRHTADLASVTREADILVAAAGSPGLIGAAHVREGQTVIDVGTNPVMEDGKRRLVGDVGFDAVKGIVAAISPVPGGVGPMTVASLFENLLDAHRLLK